MKKLLKESLKTIIKQVLSEMNLQAMLSFANFDEKVKERMLKDIENLRVTDPQEYARREAEIKKDVANVLLDIISRQGTPTGETRPAARTPAQRFQTRN
jgi:hypothetical protein